MDNGFWGGAERASGTILNTVSNLKALQQQGKHQRALEANDMQRLEMQKAHYDSINQEREMEMRQKEVALAQAQEDMKPVDADLFLSSKGFTAGQIKYVKDVASKGGLIEQDGQYSYVPKKAGAEFLGKFVADPEHNVNLGRIGMQEIDAQRAQIAQALADPKLKPEDAQKLKAQDAELANKRTDLFHRTKLSQQEFDAKSKPVEEKKNISHVDLGDRVDIYQNGELIGTKRKGMTPAQANKSSEGGKGGSKNPIQDEIKKLKDFRKTHEANLGEEGLMKVDALISGVMNGKIKPGTIEYPDVVDNGRLVHKKKSSNSNANNDPLGIR